jgi:tetratricopeptide (TPR) repeat protein
MVNLGLIYKLNELIDVTHKGESEAAKLFKAAVDKDRANFPNEVRKRNPAALVNLGVIQYEYSKYEEAAILFLDALTIKPDDQEALCNLGLSLKHTAYKDYAELALEEAVNVSPGNTFVLTNYMMLLLEQQKFDMFKRVLPHAKRIMDSKEFAEINKLHEEF